MGISVNKIHFAFALLVFNYLKDESWYLFLACAHFYDWHLLYVSTRVSASSWESYKHTMDYSGLTVLIFLFNSRISPETVIISIPGRVRFWVSSKICVSSHEYKHSQPCQLVITEDKSAVKETKSNYWDSNVSIQDKMIIFFFHVFLANVKNDLTLSCHRYTQKTQFFSLAATVTVAVLSLYDCCLLFSISNVQRLNGNGHYPQQFAV